jgi:hypothetical protein
MDAIRKQVGANEIRHAIPSVQSANREKHVVETDTAKHLNLKQSHAPLRVVAVPANDAITTQAENAIHAQIWARLAKKAVVSVCWPTFTVMPM